MHDQAEPINNYLNVSEVDALTALGHFLKGDILHPQESLQMTSSRKLWRSNAVQSNANSYSALASFYLMSYAILEALDE